MGSGEAFPWKYPNRIILKVTAMAKYADKKDLGSSKIAPFVPGENWSERHARRLTTNLSEKEKVEKFCRENAWSFLLSNNGHHWRFNKNGQFVEWWPSSAKLVINKKYKSGIHCHDYEKFIGVMKNIDAQRKTA